MQLELVERSGVLDPPGADLTPIATINPRIETGHLAHFFL